MEDVNGYIGHIAKIKETMLGYEDHGIFTALLNVDYGGAGQSVGGYDLRLPNQARIFILGVLRACHVERWEQVKGRTIYVLFDGTSYHDKIMGIAPLPTEQGKVFLFEELMEDGA